MGYKIKMQKLNWDRRMMTKSPPNILYEIMKKPETTRRNVQYTCFRLEIKFLRCKIIVIFMAIAQTIVLK